MSAAGDLIGARRHELSVGMATAAIRTLESAVRAARAEGDARRQLEAALPVAEPRYRAPQRA